MAKKERRRSVPFIIAALFVLGFGLRLWNATTAYVHDDEVHYARDATWAYSDLSLADKARFLRNHMRDHVRLVPGHGGVESWGEEGRPPRIGHPTFWPLVLSPVLFLTRPESDAAVVTTGRVANAMLDSLTIVMLPVLARSVGSIGGGIPAAFLYAVYPPAVTYGSLAYPDALLAPLLALLMYAVTREGTGVRRQILAAVTTVLLISTKQTGLIALAIVPVGAVLVRTARLRDILLWALLVIVLAPLLVNPVAYVEGLQHPLDPYGRIRTNTIQVLIRNIELFFHPAHYYWLSFARHGRPLASVFARVNQVVTPAFLMLMVGGVVWAVCHKRVRLLVVTLLPAGLVLCLLPPSDGAWRWHLLSPLGCLAAGVFLAESSGGLRNAAVAATAVMMVAQVLPLRPARGGAIDIADVLFANPGEVQPYGFYDPLRGRPLVMVTKAGNKVTRRLWINPGEYELRVSASGWITVMVDGEVVFGGTTGRTSVMLTGHLHSLELSFSQPGQLRSIAFVPVSSQAASR